MTTKRDMDKRLQLLRHLYGELEDERELRSLLEDEEAVAEYVALSESKRALDLWRRPSRPDPAVVDRLVAAASRRRLRVVWRRTAYAAIAAAAVIAGIVALSATREEVPQDPLAGSDAQEELSWDEAGSLVDIHSRISALNARSSTQLWDAADVMSLDSLPATGTLNGISTANSR